MTPERRRNDEKTIDDFGPSLGFDLLGSRSNPGPVLPSPHPLPTMLGSDRSQNRRPGNHKRTGSRREVSRQRIDHKNLKGTENRIRIGTKMVLAEKRGRQTMAG